MNKWQIKIFCESKEEIKQSMSDNKTDTNRHAKIGTMGPHECECFYWSLTK